MARYIRQTQIATYGLGDVTNQDAWRVAFPEVNFFELFPEAIDVRLIQPGTIDFVEEVNSVTIKLTTSEQQQLISVRQQAQPGGEGLGSHRKKGKNKDDDDYQWRNLSTRVRAFSIHSEESIGAPNVIFAICPVSIVERTTIGKPTVELLDDEEALIMMLLAA